MDEEWVGVRDEGLVEQSGGPPVIQFRRVTQVQTVRLVLKVIHQIKTRDKQTNKQTNKEKRKMQKNYPKQN